MKILCVSPLFPSEKRPYYSIYLLQQLKCLQEDGNEINVLIPDTSIEIGQIKEEEYERIPIYRVGYRTNKIYLFVNHMPKKFKSAVNGIVKKLSPDIISLNFCQLPIVSVFLKIRKIPVAVYFHGLNVWEEYKICHPIYGKLDTLRRTHIYKKADGIIGVSEKVCDIARKHIDSGKVYRVYNGVDTSVFYPINKGKPIETVFTIACVANLNKTKGQEYLLRAVAEVRNELTTEIKVDIIGNGPELANLKSLAKDLGIADSVEFRGEWLYTDIAEYFRKKCDFFIMPSYYEALGCVYLEAMASGVAALGVYGGGIDEIIEDGISGYLAEPQDTAKIAAAIREAVSDREKFDKIAQEGYRKITENYTWRDSANDLLKAYNKMIHNGSKEEL